MIWAGSASGGQQGRHAAVCSCWLCPGPTHATLVLLLQNASPPALTAPSWTLAGGKMGYEIPVNGTELWKGALAHSRQQSVHKSGSWVSCRAGASARGVAKEGGAVRPAASTPRLAGPGSKRRPEIPACSVLQPRNTSLESCSGTDFLSLITARDRKAPVGQSTPSA